MLFGGKYSASDNFCYAEFLAYYASDINKSRDSSSEEYQPDELKDNLVAENHEEKGYPSQIKLMRSKETISCPEVRKVFCLHTTCFISRKVFP